MALDIKRFTARFVEEAREHLVNLEAGLAALQQEPADQEVVNAIFRSAHTIKGSSRMLRLAPISDTAHRLEDLLGALREGTLTYSHALAQLLQSGIDAIAAQVDEVAQGRELAPPDEALCAALARPLTPDAETAKPAESVPVAAAAPGEIKFKAADSVRIPLEKLDELIKLMGEVVSSHARLRQRSRDIRAIERDLRAGSAGRGARVADFARELKDDVQAQEALMEELHGKALILRMLPLLMVFDPAPRMVRDLARSVGKEVECLVSGSEIELDRQLIDRLGDPIVHLLRNAVDHGIEAPDVRAKAGKPRHGRVSLSARQDDGGVIIEVRDDGAGLSLEAIRDKAVKKGLASAEQVALFTEAEVIDLIFLPGFSTSAIITDVSGRGVGMDVVKRCVVDELQGAIQVESKPGVGTTFTLRLPRSLAVMRMLLVAAGGQTFGFTAPHVSQLLRLPADQLLEVAERHAVLIRNEFVPVVSLAQMLSLPAQPAGADLLLVVVQTQSEKLALRVDDLIDERNMVIKPLPPHLAGLPLVAGMVMTGRNQLVSVLQAPALVGMARRGSAGSKQTTIPAASQVRVLVVDDSLNTREIEKDVLEAHGYHVTLAEDGLDGLAKARNGEFDAVLTDVEMPNMDGFALTAALRQEERYRDVPIIIITSRQKEEDQRRGIQVGADAYIVKGDFDQSRLIDTLKSLLG
ncbi:MAG: hybrid sensor histidine kinase/response regulator [Proteobacteria bacterium]|nr:hybrid sensor histidine kinase/response regulator [Pseudomonadota bacterium]